ncbi:MAG: hypothetical protein IJ225_05675 [Solobacterium sp.]|nr:hypothetical protein [Solobacterium sp.]
MNSFLNAQINNMINTLQVFLTGCELAAKQDDGKIDRSEEKTLKKVRKATEDYIKVLKSIRG